MTTNLDLLRIQDSQRLDRGDVEFLARASMAGTKEVVTKFLLGHSQYVGDVGPGTTSRPPTKIISGFKLELALPPGTNNQLLVKRGTALLGMRDPQTQQPSYGVVAGVGDDQKILDLSAYSNGTYGVWLRFELADGEFANRVFWDPLAVKEYTQNIATRWVANWGLTTVAGGGIGASPGGEWTYLGDVVKSAGPLAVTPKRNLYFEGDETSTYAQAWGSANDRNNDRSTYGLQDLSAFVSATLQKLQELQGTNWWLTTAEPLNNKLSKAGDAGYGNYSFHATGPASTFFVDSKATFDGSTLDVNSLTTFANHIRSSGAYDVGGSSYKFRHLYLSGDVYADGGATFGGVINANGIINANAGIRTNGGDDIGSSGTPFVNLYAQRGVFDKGTASDGENLALYGSTSGFGIQGVAFKTTAAETVAAGFLWFEAGGLLGFQGLNFTSQRNSDSFSLALKNSSGVFKKMRFGNGDGSLTVEGGVFPWTDSTAPANGYPLGTASLRWSYLYAQAAVIYNQIAAGAGTVDIGASGNPFQYGFASAWNASAAVNVGTFGSAETYLTPSSGRFGYHATFPTGGAFTWAFNNGVEIAGSLHATTNVQADTGTYSPVYQNLNAASFTMYANPAADDNPIARWDQRRQFGSIWEFRYNNGGTPPSVGSPTNITDSDAIIARGPWGYALRCFVWNGSGWVVCYIPAYYYDHVP